jgi:hypothetical protein
VDCNSGKLTITANTLPDARTGRLNLSDGSHIISRLVLVPRHLGGPATYYYQVVRGPSPVPVSLTEIDARGRALHVLHLTRVVECTEHPVKILPGGLRTIARDRVPGGPSFRIIGEHFRFLGKVEFHLKIEVARGGGGGTSGFVVGAPTHFVPQTASGCRPHPYTVVYGILDQRSDVVLARVRGALHELRRVRIPASLHVKGVVAYAAFSEEPSELIVRAPNGRTLEHEKFGFPLGAPRCTSEQGEEGEGEGLAISGG